MAESSQQPGRSRVQTREALGLLIIAALVLIFSVVRYWHHIPWSAR